MAAGLAGNASAAGRDPLVIQGIGPQDFSPTPDRHRSATHRRQVRQAAAPQPARTRVASNRGQYGGGFIEFLITGNSGSSPVVAPEPRYRRRSMNATYTHGQQPRYRRQRQAFAEPVPAFRRNLPKVVPAKYQRQEVAYSGKHRAGTVIVNTQDRFLYYVLGNGRAIRYGIGVGRPGFEWSGVKKVSRKAEWPSWRPPSEMLKRRPDLPRFMEGGPSNPLGARALYLGSSLYRIHGTNEPNTIGTNVSSGCIRMLNKDVIDLYGRVRVGAKVIVS
ncbi:MAG: L,D-transpeptidase [Hyphomicrobiales bacterium]|nr:L,D-transpeptidase [Hyphomicrobiales bacterium]